MTTNATLKAQFIVGPKDEAQYFELMSMIMAGQKGAQEIGIRTNINTSDKWASFTGPEKMIRGLYLIAQHMVESSDMKDAVTMTLETEDNVRQIH